MVRAFVAIDVKGPELADFVGIVQKRLATLRSKVTSVDATKLHITLKFLGDVPEAALGPVKERLEDVVRPRFSFEVRGLGVLPNERRPRVIYLAVRKGAREVAQLAAKVEDALASLGFPREKREFRAHVTLARIKQPWLARDLPQIFSEFEEASAYTVEIEDLRLKKSLLTPSGPIYSDLHVVRLAD
ncbi:MAG: RNA 2',3'-cyclic phosphodiesterase [Candidatus Geothermarchaeales archaeon]